MDTKVAELGCQQVISRKGKRCGKPAVYRPGLFYILCEKHAEYLRRVLNCIWGIPWRERNG